MTTREIRLQAAALIESRGWARRACEEYGGADSCRLSVVRALWTADEDAHGWRAARVRHSVADQAIGEVEHELGIRDLRIWGSRPRRTLAEVLAALRGPGYAPEVAT